MKLLIADDSTLIQEHLAGLIYQFTEIKSIQYAENVPQAIETIIKDKPDVVVLDMHMPGGSGIDVLKSVQKENHRPIFIVFTNYPYSRLRKACFAAGADFFFDKSFDHNQLLVLLNKLIKKLKQEICIGGGENGKKDETGS